MLLMDYIDYFISELYRCYYIIIITETILQHNIRSKVIKYKVITVRLLLCILTYTAFSGFVVNPWGYVMCQFNSGNRYFHVSAIVWKETK